MPELWTFSGINSWDGEKLVDRVSGHLKLRGITRSSDRSYISQLGTGRDYEGSNDVFALDSERRLDDEAQSFVNGEIDEDLGVDAGELADKTIRALFVAPKSDTRPAKAFDCVIYWSPYDIVPNQSVFRPPSLTFWRRWATTLRKVGGSAKVYPVPAESHGMENFLRGARPTVKWKPKPGPKGKGTPGRKGEWVPTDRIAPDPLDTVTQWLAQEDTHIVMVGHSQGANIALAVLNRGLV